MLLIIGVGQISPNIKKGSGQKTGDENIPTLSATNQAPYVFATNLTDSPPLVDQEPQETDQDITEIKVEIPGEAEKLNQPESGSEEAVGESYFVSRVIDGDTIELNTGQRVRYIGIDTPEITKGKNECFGQEAKLFNQELVLNKQVVLTKDISETDRYGRLLRYVYIDGQFINEELVKKGYATSATFPPDVKYSSYFNQLQSQARALNLGLWGGCSQETKNPNSSTIPQTDRTNCPADQPIKGNAQSKIYHLPDAKYYDQTKPEECFATEQEATKAGYRKSKV